MHRSGFSTPAAAELTPQGDGKPYSIGVERSRYAAGVGGGQGGVNVDMQKEGGCRFT